MNLGNNDKLTLNIYLQELFMQFKDTNGIKASVPMEKIEKEFCDWISKMYIVKKRYADFLSSVGIKHDELIAEVGKGKYDTIVPDLVQNGMNAIAITPYARTIDEVAAYNGRLTISPVISEPTIVYSSEKEMQEQPNCNSYFNRDITTMITQLPTYLIDTFNMKALIESSRLYNDVVIGAYGFTNDKDINSKLKSLQSLKEQIESQYCVSCDEEYYTENGTYHSLIIYHQKTLEKTLSRYRHR